MSIELQEARKKLDILEELVNNPELILTNLFNEGVNCTNFLHQVNIKGKYILDYLVEYLKTLHIFDDTFLKFSGYELNIYVPSLKYGEYQQFQSEDKILKVNIKTKTYKLCDKDIQKYSDVMARVYKLDTCELSYFWKKYDNFTFRNRIKNALMSLVSNKKINIRLWDFIFILFVSKKKIEVVVNREKEKVINKNNYNQKNYDKQIDLQNYYRENAPDHINMICSKQNEIINYLTHIGYQEDVDMSEY